MTQRVRLARQALRAAMELRKRYDVARDVPVCPYDLAEKHGVEVKFRAEKSLEGMYVKGPPPVALVSAFRPAGRRAFSCSHELGHHVFGHGTRVDEYVADPLQEQTQPEEILANFFAGALLMPPAAVRRAFQDREWDASQCSPEQAFVVAGHLGASYEALIQHLRMSLELLSPQNAERLLKAAPKQIRAYFMGRECEENLIVVDKNWQGRAIDAEVGDSLLLPANCIIEGNNLVNNQSLIAMPTFTVVRAGICRVATPDGSWSAFVRVSRKNFVGRSICRHWEDPDEN